MDDRKLIDMNAYLASLPAPRAMGADNAMAMRGRETFLEACGTDFAYLPCLNDTAPGIEMLQLLLRRELAGWIAAS